VVGLSTDRLADTVILAMQAGRSTTALAGGQLLIDTTTAQNDHLAVGSIVPVTFALTGTSTMRVGGIFEPNAFIGSYLVGGRFFLSHFSNPLPIGVLVRSKNGRRQRGPDSQRASQSLPERRGPDAGPVREVPGGQHQLLGLVYALPVLIALTGIVNTLLLSCSSAPPRSGCLGPWAWSSGRSEPWSDRRP
jgi:hypothetical protein